MDRLYHDRTAAVSAQQGVEPLMVACVAGNTSSLFFFFFFS